MIKINYAPNSDHFIQIKKWLFEQEKDNNDGFHNHWNMILVALNTKNTIIITDNDYPIGFIVYHIFDFVAKVSITVIKESERKKGVAKILINESLDFFKLKGALVTELYCSPEESELFWKKMGFINIPSNTFRPPLSMYKTLIDSLSYSKEKEGEYVIKLWFCEPYETKGRNPDRIWNLNLGKGEKILNDPIIYPVSKDWKIEFIRDGVEDFSGKIKYFNIDSSNYSDYLLIKELNEIVT